MIRVFILTALIISSCSQQTELKIADLKFPSPDKEGVIANAIDSTFLVSEFNSGKDTVGLITYDSLGRILYDGSDPWNSYRYKYDNVGILTGRWHREWDSYFDFHGNYWFSDNNHVLTIRWTGDYPYTTRFEFDSAGYLIEETTDRPDKKITFSYGQDHKLSGKEETKYKDTEFEEKMSSSVYYSDRILDSIVTTVNSRRWGRTTKIVDHYSPDGLRLLTETHAPDTVYRNIEYIHKKRRGKNGYQH